MSIHHLGPINGIASHKSTIATAGCDNQLILWDRHTRSALQRVHHDRPINHCAFSPDGHWLVSASSDCTARVWSVPDMKLQSVLADHADDVVMAAFSPDSQTIATGALDRCIRIFTRQGQCLHTLPGHTGNVLSLTWSPDGRQLITSGMDGTIRTWDAQSGDVLHCTYLGLRSNSVEMSSAGCIFAGDADGRIAIIENGSPRFVAAHPFGVKKIAINETQGLVVSLGHDRTLAVWHMDHRTPHTTLTEISRTELPDTIWARAATVLEDGRIACGTVGHTYAVYDLHSHQWDLPVTTTAPTVQPQFNASPNSLAIGLWKANTVAHPLAADTRVTCQAQV